MGSSVRAKHRRDSIEKESLAVPAAPRDAFVFVPTNESTLCRRRWLQRVKGSSAASRRRIQSIPFLMNAVLPPAGQICSGGRLKPCSKGSKAPALRPDGGSKGPKDQ